MAGTIGQLLHLDSCFHPPRQLGACVYTQNTDTAQASPDNECAVVLCLAPAGPSAGREASCPGMDGVWELICPRWLSGTGSIAYILAKPCSLQAMAAAVWSEMQPKPLLPKFETISCSLVSHQPGPQLDHPSWLLPCLNTSNKVAACQELFSGTQVSTWAQG